jgi:predicted metal-dependent enzyme (double-stranded beta helix superfamily)
VDEKFTGNLRQGTRERGIISQTVQISDWQHEPAARDTGSMKKQSARTHRTLRFDVHSFVEECRCANQETAADKQAAIREVLSRAMSEPSAVIAAVGEPQKGGIQTLYRAADLTILNIVWAPLMQLLPHEHRMWSVIGIYSGREDNIFWERQQGRIAATRAAAIATGDVVSLPVDVVHSVANPIEKLTGAIHIYGGDFFATPRSEWDPESLAERAWSIERAMSLFAQSNERFRSQRKKPAEPDRPPR